MKNLSEEIEQLSNQVLQDNKRILDLLTTLQIKNGISSSEIIKHFKPEPLRKVKTPSIVTTTSKKIGVSKQKTNLNNSFKTVKRLNSSQSTHIHNNRCDSCKLLKKQSSEKKLSVKKIQKSQFKNWANNIKKQTSISKLKKLSEKMIPKVSNRFIYVKKSSVTHFEGSSKRAV